MGIGNYTISLTTALVLVVMTAVLCTSMFAYYQTQSGGAEAPQPDNAPRAAPDPPQKEAETRNVHLFWNDDEAAIKFINGIKQDKHKPFGILACIFHPSCGFSKQFNEPFAKLANEIENVHDDVTVVKIFPKDMGLIAKLFEPINIRGYPTVIGDFTNQTRIIDQYTPQSTSKPFRSVESMTEYIEMLKSKASSTEPVATSEPEPEPQPLAAVEEEPQETQPQRKASAEKADEENEEEQPDANAVAEEQPVDDSSQPKPAKKRRGRKPASHSD